MKLSFSGCFSSFLGGSLGSGLCFSGSSCLSLCSGLGGSFFSFLLGNSFSTFSIYFGFCSFGSFGSLDAGVLYSADLVRNLGISLSFPCIPSLLGLSFRECTLLHTTVKMFLEQHTFV